jgi:hypothetical protein
MMSFAEDLGKILGTAQQKASTWLSDRQEITKQLRQVRDAAERLLQDIAGEGTTMVAAVEGAQTDQQPIRRRRRLSPEGRRRIVEAARKRWAAVRATQEPKRKRRISAAARKRMSEAAKRRWAAKAKGAKTKAARA